MKRKSHSELIAQGPTPWASTCGLTGGANVVTAFWRRIGDLFIAEIDVTFSTVFTGGNATFTLPSGISPGVNKIPGTEVQSLNPQFGWATCHDVGTAQYPAIVMYDTSTTVGLRMPRNPSTTLIDNEGVVSTGNPFTWANNDRMHLNFQFTVDSWNMTRRIF